MTRPRLTSWVSGLGTFLIAVLVATPLWDFWHYRGLRTGPGAGVPVGLILQPPAAPRPALAAGLQPSPLGTASIAERSSFTASAAASNPFASSETRRAETRAVDVSATAGGNPGLHDGRDAGATAPRPRSTSEPARDGASGSSVVVHGGAGPHGKAPVPHPKPHGEPPAPGPEQPAGTPGGGAPAASGGWLLTMPPPVTTGTPRLPPPEPQPGPPPPRTVEPAPSRNDPKVIPQALPVLTLQSPPDSVAVGQDVTVTIRLSGADNVTSIPFHLIFDPAVLDFVSADNGSALSGLQPVLLASVNPARPGDLAVGLSFIDTGGTFNGSGTLLELRFHALAAGSTTLQFDRASIRGRISQALEAQFENGSISVR